MLNYVYMQDDAYMYTLICINVYSIMYREIDHNTCMYK